jgi:putative sterol carrier protein
MAFTTSKEVFAAMPAKFNPTAATGLDVVFQFHIEGEGGADYYVAVKDQKVTVTQGVHDDPTVSLRMKEEDWVSMVNGELDGMSAFMSGKLNASGDIMMAQRIQTLFTLA